MDVPFELKTEIRENRVIISTSGYINNIGGEAISKEFENYFNQGHKHIILNMSGSKVVNSVGISFLLEILEKLQETDGKLIFTNLDPAVDKMLTIMGIFKFAGKASDIAEAFRLLPGG
jgi:anti-anti-sigma factor